MSAYTISDLTGMNPTEFEFLPENDTRKTLVRDMIRDSLYGDVDY